MSLYTVNIDNKHMQPVSPSKLSELGLTERYDLQEWLVCHPSALGEPLLIIQKEFAGFDKTNERLDLLAIDSKGNLVIIENKRDDSGKDVVWQAIKYASYCALLTTKDIIEVFAQYLSKYKPSNPTLSEDAYAPEHIQHTAERLIFNFLKQYQDNLADDLNLNLRNTQRLILVAGVFSTEVTSTALWMRDRGIDVKCIKVLPYHFEQKLLLQIQPIIPIPEASEYMVRLSRKDAEETINAQINATRFDVRQAYWEKLLSVFQDSPNKLYNNISPSKNHWLSTGSGLSSCPYSLIFLQKELRVEFEFGCADTDENKFLFDFFMQHKTAIEQAFGAPLEWLRLDHKKSSRVQYSLAADDCYNQALWDDWIHWHLESVSKLAAAFKPYIEQVKQTLKSRNAL